VLAGAIAGLVRAQQLLPAGEAVYSHGYAYQAVAAALCALTGLPVAAFQQLLSPFLLAVLLLPLAWVTYRELAGGAAAATLATLLLLLEPEFLFVVLRGSHEKITRTLMLLALFLLARSLRLSRRPGRFAAYVLLFHAAGYGIIASNNLFGSSFVAAIALALAAGWPLARRWGAGSLEVASDLSRRLLYSVCVLLAVAFVFTFYAYSPAAHQLGLYREVWHKVAVLLLDLGQARPVGDPYAAVAGGWVNLQVYLLVSLANWLLIGVSLSIWLRQGWRWLGRGIAPESHTAWLLWLLYGAFGLQGVGAVLTDFSGAIATNLQHRAFASFSVVAAAAVARGVTPLLGPQGRGRAGYWRTAGARPLLAAGAGCLAALSILKASNEPALSNKWTFYEPPEIQALRWAGGHLRAATIWTEFDERLLAAYQLVVESGDPRPPTLAGGNRLDAFVPKPGGRDFLITDVTRRRAARLGTALPPATTQLRTYDNGAAEIYHLVPSTPYQR
jgi:hypothetical protein